MNLSENAEEILENLWILAKEKGEPICNYCTINTKAKDEAIDELIKLKLS